MRDTGISRAVDATRRRRPHRSPACELHAVRGKRDRDEVAAGLGCAASGSGGDLDHTLAALRAGVEKTNYRHPSMVAGPVWSQ